MTLEDILKLDIQDKNVAIVGMPASGKSWLAKYGINWDNTHTQISTDKWKGFGYENGPYLAARAIIEAKRPIIVEGVYLYNILRNGEFKPDLIIECQRPKYKREQTYLTERSPEKIKYLQKFELGLLLVWNEFLMNLAPEMRPEIITFENDY